MIIRLATAADSAAMRRIYAQYIDTPITFECVLPTEAECARRIVDTLDTYPFLACEQHGEVIGYACAHRHGGREAYQWNTELSIYLDRAHVSGGMGKRLYHVLIELLKLQGVKTVYGGVTIPNKKSEGLHTALGFRRAGLYHSTGYKCGAWRDVVWFEKQIAPYDADPAPIIPIGEIAVEKLDALFTAN